MPELIVDSFAGGGGASLGIAQALGRSPDVAINHNPAALAMHAANHPETRHYPEDVWKVAPREVTGGRPVGLLWCSPDCKHFSRAKGGKPVEKKIRSLAWVAIRWAVEGRPRLIILENVREFQDWGPLTEDNLPDPARKGLTFKRFTGRLRNLGYAVAWRVLDAADYGAPTHRRRLFLVARCDGRPIVWPEATHGDPRTIGTWLFDRDLKPWRTAAECIDWSLPCPSIFLTAAEAKAAGVRRPLAPKTLARIAAGVKRYVLDNAAPFIVCCNHGGAEFRGQGLGQPLPTLTASRGAHGLVTPFIARIGQTGSNGACVCSVGDPLTTVVSKAEHLLVAPYLVQRYGERPGQTPRTSAVGEPFGVVTPTANCGSLAAVTLSRYHGSKGGESRCQEPRDPLCTLDTQNRVAVVAAFLAKHYGGVVGQPLTAPIGTVTAVDHHSLAVANLVHLNHGHKTSSGCDEPLRTASGKHAALVCSFLTKYYGTAIGQSLGVPLHTATGTDRFGVVTVQVAGQPYAIVDIGMRMLPPRELARGNGFPDSYLLTGSATAQVERIGNSVPPPVAEAIVRELLTIARGLQCLQSTRPPPTYSPAAPPGPSPAAMPSPCCATSPTPAVTPSSPTRRTPRAAPSGATAQKTASKYEQSTNKVIARPEFTGDNRDGRGWAYWCALWLGECLRVTRPAGYCLMFCDWRQLPTASDLLQAGGWVYRGICVWDKTEGARAPHTGYFRHQAEYVVWGTAGVSAPAAWCGPGEGCWPGVFRAPVKQCDKYHLAGKPPAVMRWLLACVPPGGLVLDPFAGSATTLAVAVETGRRAIGFELDRPTAEVARARLRGELTAAGTVPAAQDLPLFSDL